MHASVVVATYNRPDSLPGTIEGILESAYPSYELIVVDQTPSYPEDVRCRLDELARRHSFRCIRLRLPSLPLARNVGIREATGEVVIFCDDDVIVGPDFIPRHVACYEDPAVGAVAGRVISRLDASLAHASGLTGRVLQDGSFIANFHLERRSEVDFGMGCNMSFRRSALVELGGFDERYTGAFYREEGDTFARIKRRGYRVLFEPAAVLEHLAAPDGGCRKDTYVPRMYSIFRNETLFFLNCMERRHLPRLLYRLLRWIYATVKGRGYALTYLLYFSRAPLEAWVAHRFQSRDVLTRALETS